jgi:tetratricopeptide (TPR) repeat protein
MPEVPSGEPQFRFVHRELVLVAVLVGVAVAAFLLTRLVARQDVAIRQADADAWYRQGLGDLDAGRLESAIARLRRAAAKNPQAARYRLALARVLAADRQYDAAEQILAGLRGSAPEDPEINIELARVEARRQDVTGGVRFYQSALNALWRADQAQERRRVRLELVRFLLDHEQPDRALPELLILTTDLPDDADSRREVGWLFLRAGSANRALEQFSLSLLTRPSDADALAGAGQSAFALGDYARAHRYLDATTVDSARVRDLRELSALVLAHDPLAPRLAQEERVRRLMLNVQQATARLESCLSQPQVEVQTPRVEMDALLADIRTFGRGLTLAHVRTSPDPIEAGAELVDRAERAAEACGTPTMFDRALLLIGGREGLKAS